jgi:hypothetical protein
MIGAGIATAYFIYKFWKHEYHTDYFRVAVIQRVIDESLGQKGYVKLDVIETGKQEVELPISPPVNNATLITGMAGTGKSTNLTNQLWRESENGHVVIFSLKTFPSWTKEDFVNIPNFNLIDITQFLPSDIFSDPDRFASSFALAVLSHLSMRGMMFKAVYEQVRNLVAGGITSWNDFERAIDKMSRDRNNNFDRSVLSSIRDSIQQFKRFHGKQENLNIDWTHIKENYILSFSSFGDDNEALKIFYAEYLLRDLFSRQLGYVLAIDECHLLLKNTGSILATILRTGRVSTKLYVATQNLSDIENAHLQFGSVYLHYTINKDDFTAIHDDFVRDAVKHLRGHRFISLTEQHHNQSVSVYELDIANFKKACDEWNMEQKKVNDSIVSSSVPPVLLPEPVATVSVTPQEPRGDKREIKNKILYMLESNCHIGNDFNTELGYGRDDKRRFAVKEVLKDLVNSNDIRLMSYVTQKKNISPRKYYYRNEDKTESTCHRLLVSDIGKVVENIGDAVIADYQSNQSWDIETPKYYCDAVTGLKKGNIKDDISKLRVATKPVIFVCINRDVLVHYNNTLSVVDGIEGKYSVCCLDDLSEIIMNLEMR